jgi:hypothetical protein
LGTIGQKKDYAEYRKEEKEQLADVRAGEDDEVAS